MTRSPPREPLIAIIGATGTGKSQLAVELAKRYNGEVINGDAMQLYAGLPIITNKATAEEQQGIPHHLLGCIGLKEQTWVVGSFVKKGLSVIEEIRGRGKVPILVGGTHYYLQGLLFRDHLADDGGQEGRSGFVRDTSEQWPMLKADTDVLLDELKKVDPVMADRWHPNDRRKIQRSLEIYLQTGRRASDMYAEQRSQQNTETALGGDGTSLRFPTLLFWIHAETSTLITRLEERVDRMLAAGLLEEVRTLDTFVATEAAEGRTVDETRGIWVSIGYKEFKPYMQALQAGETGEKELEEALERTKIATRQYAKRQVRWIRIKLANALASANAADSLYLLDGTDISQYDSKVAQTASEITHSFLTASSPLPDPMTLSAAAAEMLTPKKEYDLSAEWKKKHCEVCDVTCIGEEQWGMHAKSKMHRKLSSRRKKAEEEMRDEAGAGG